jgi:hypothetical protein
MAITTKVLSDTKTHAKVLLTFDNDTATTAAAVDGSNLSGHDNGAKLHINHINYGITGRLKLEFKGSSSDVEAINLSGAGIYYGAVIKNTAENTTVTGGDIEGITAGASGYALLTLAKQDMGENS